MHSAVAVLGTYQSRFATQVRDKTYVEQMQEAAVGVLGAAGMTPDDVDAFVVSLAPTAFMGIADADRWAIDPIFASGKPIMRIHTGGATGGSALHAAWTLVRSGRARSVMIVGADRVADTPDAQKVLNTIFDPFYERALPLSTNTLAALRTAVYMHRHGSAPQDLARVVVRARRNALRNPHAHLKGDITVEDVLASPLIAYPMRLFDVCPRSSGSAAMIIGDMRMARRFCPRPAFINGLAGASDTYWMGDRMGPSSDTDIIEYDLASRVAQQCYRQAGITDPLRQIRVAEFYDPYSIHTPIMLEQCGFCSRGTALRLEADGCWDSETGAVAVNPSGGTLCTNPIAVAGLVRAIDAADQVMGRAGDMQVAGVSNVLCTATGGTAQFFNCTVMGDEPRGAAGPPCH